ncbi:MAG: hypothetical protein MJ061_02050 [Mailhella sp.]|nr:hypothetical protein [Mailhella sp.]
MKKGLTELVFILDRSGSMSGLESDTIGGFNSMIAKQKKAEGEAVVSTVLFNEASRVLHDRVPLDRVAPLTDGEYEPAGCTALLDAVGDAVRHIGLVHKYARSEDVPEHTVFVITTDGMENASRRYGLEEVRRLITRQSEKYGWEFLFLGANIDAVETAGRMGIRPERSAEFTNDAEGITENFKALDIAISACRACGHVAESWADGVRRNHASRSARRSR